MLHRRVNGYDMAYIEVGQGGPMVCVHGSLGDFRTWSPVLGPLSCDHRVIVPSLRRFFPEQWDGIGEGFTIAQHTADLIAFLESSGGKLALVGHSRGGHLAFRVAERRPDLLRALVLAEPGGDLDPSLRPATVEAQPPQRARFVAAAERIAAGDIEDGLRIFVEGIEGPKAWEILAPAAKQELRDNARTLLGQVNEGRPPFTRAEAEAIRVPTLLVGGADSEGRAPVVLRALAAHIPGAQVAIVPDAKHMMFRQNPVPFCAAVLDFLATV